MRVEGVRRVLALVTGLPLEAAAWRADGPDWTRQDELLAVNAEVADAGFRAVFQALGGKARGKPLRIEHPARHGGRQRRRVSMGELMKGGGAT